MSELKPLKELKSLAQADAANVSGGEGDCPVTVTLDAPGVTIQNTGYEVGTTVMNTITGTYEGIIQATSYAIERVINAVTSSN